MPEPDEGRWVTIKGRKVFIKGGIGGPTFYMGLRSDLISSVKQNGITRKGKHHKRPPSVYVAEDPALAHAYALSHAAKKISELSDDDVVEGVIFEIEVPEDRLGDLVPDEKMPGLMFPHARPDSWRMERDIPPEWIKGHKVYRANVKEYRDAPWDKKHEVFRAVEVEELGKGVRFFVAFLKVLKGTSTGDDRE